MAAPLDQLTKSKDSRLRFQPVAAAERQTIARHGQDVQKLRDQRRTLEAKAAVRPTGKPSKEFVPARVRLPGSPIVAKPVAELGKDHAPPKLHEAPKPDPKVARKPRVDRIDQPKPQPKSKIELPTPKTQPKSKIELPKTQPKVVQPTPKPQPKVVQPTPTPKPQPKVVQPTPTSKAQPKVVKPTPTPKPQPKVVKPTPTPRPQPKVERPAPRPQPQPKVERPAPKREAPPKAERPSGPAPKDDKHKGKGKD